MSNKPLSVGAGTTPLSAFPMPSMTDWFDYAVDAWQRSILTLDVLRQRGNNAEEHNARLAPHVLSFGAEVIIDGRTLPRPVNYALVRIKSDTPPDPRKRPFIIFDPRAGHGPGIGGMKHDSEIGEVLKAGHPCYFVGFLPVPTETQTIEDVCEAEAIFVRKVVELHPQADAKPCLIGNCQAGWQILMMSAIAPDDVGPILVAGTPLSYWAGVRGKNPLRYLGGMLGGTWLTALAGDLGNGIFDGAHLIANFESMNPANTYWSKLYNLYSNVDKEAPRYLDFEKWWGSPVLLRAEEMQAIADQLFVGNHLTAGEIKTRAGTRVDLRNIRSPIVVLCSWGDDITPPQQALGWVLDLYDNDREIVENGQTIVYTLHQSIGHLGIFVSGKVATKEHREFTSCMDLIDLMPPGLYEAIITDAQGEDNPDLIGGNYLFKLVPRTLADIKSLGHNSQEDERQFASVRAVSEANLGLYRTFASPVVKAMTSEQTARALRKLHPNRAQVEMFSDKNPAMAVVQKLAVEVAGERRPVGAENPFLKMEMAMSESIVRFWDAYASMRDAATENIFTAVYGSPMLQAMAGLRSDTAESRQGVQHDLLREASARHHEAELLKKRDQGGWIAACLRAMLYVHGRGTGADERGMNLMREISAELPKGEKLGFSAIKQLLRDQVELMKLEPQEALSAIPQLLPDDPRARAEKLKIVSRIAQARGPLEGEAAERMAEVTELFAVTPAPLSRKRLSA